MAFQGGAFQYPAFQFGASPGIQYLGGDDTRYPWDKHHSKSHAKPEKLRRFETAAQFVDRLIDSFTKPPEKQVALAKEAMEQLNALAIADIPKSDFTLTYEQILHIQDIIYQQIKIIQQQQEEEEFLILAASLLL